MNFVKCLVGSILVDSLTDQFLFWSTENLIIKKLLDNKRLATER